MSSAFSKRHGLRAPARAMLALGLACIPVHSGFGQVQPATNRSKPFGPDACGPADPAYIRTANETGGIPMFLERSEAAKAFHLVRESTRNNISTVLWATGNLEGSGQRFEIPVDSTTHRITFTLSAGAKGERLVIKDPSGQVVSEGFRGAEITGLNCGRIVTVAAPEAGNWLAEITGA